MSERHQCHFYGDGYDDKWYSINCDECNKKLPGAWASEERSETELRLARIEHILELLMATP